MSDKKIKRTKVSEDIASETRMNGRRKYQLA